MKPAVAQQQADAKVAEMAEALEQVEAEQEQLNAQLDELTQSNETYKHLTNEWSQKYAQLESKHQILETTHTEQTKQFNATSRIRQSQTAILTGSKIMRFNWWISDKQSHSKPPIKRNWAFKSRPKQNYHWSWKTATECREWAKQAQKWINQSHETATAQNKAQSDEISQLKADKAGLVATNQALQAQLDSLQTRFDNSYLMQTREEEVNVVDFE